MSKTKTSTGYVVCCHSHERDGHEYWAKWVATVGAAVDYINSFMGRTNDHNLHFSVFELGKEIPLEAVTEEEPQPSKVKTKYRRKK